MNKVILAFSGGLDTSVCVKYLQNLHKLDVITLTVDVGQNDDFDEIERISSEMGAVKHIYIDSKQEFVNNYVTPAIKANALYQQKYPLATALARPHRFSSILYFLAISLILIPISLASFNSLSLVRFRSLIGAIIFKFGSRDLIVRSNLT